MIREAKINPCSLLRKTKEVKEKIKAKKEAKKRGRIGALMFAKASL